MKAGEFPSAVAAVRAVSAELGLAVDEVVVLHDSNKLTVRLLPCDVVARVAPRTGHVLQFELDLATQLVAAGCPVVAPDPRVEPRVHADGSFVATFWTHHDSSAGPVPPAEYAAALALLHAGMRPLDVSAPGFSDRVASALRLVEDPVLTPDLAPPDRELLRNCLRDTTSEITSRSPVEQLLHGEPHPGNLLATRGGPLFVDLETCCRGPVEFDLAHAPDGVGESYPGVDTELLALCRVLVLAIATTWRWDCTDEFPDGRRLGVVWLGDLRSAVQRGRRPDQGGQRR